MKRMARYGFIVVLSVLVCMVSAAAIYLAPDCTSTPEIPPQITETLEATPSSPPPATVTASPGVPVPSVTLTLVPPVVETATPTIVETQPYSPTVTLGGPPGTSKNPPEDESDKAPAVTPTLPVTGFFDDYPFAYILLFAPLLIVVIFLARRIRLS